MCDLLSLSGDARLRALRGGKNAPSRANPCANRRRVGLPFLQLGGVAPAVPSPLASCFVLWGALLSFGLDGPLSFLVPPVGVSLKSFSPTLATSADFGPTSAGPSSNRLRPPRPHPLGWPRSAEVIRGSRRTSDRWLTLAEVKPGSDRRIRRVGTAVRCAARWTPTPCLRARET